MTTQTAALTEKAKNDPTARVRELNDAFRRDIQNPALGLLVLTAGVAALMDSDIFNLINEVKAFEDFNEDNDPWQEHDFGAIKFKNQKYFFKIDYYNAEANDDTHSPDKACPIKTRRVMTIMQANEY